MHQSKFFRLQQIFVGMIIGLTIGGALHNEEERFPHIKPGSDIL